LGWKILRVKGEKGRSFQYYHIDIGAAQVVDSRTKQVELQALVWEHYEIEDDEIRRSID
jgi:hypothetical protein